MIEPYADQISQARVLDLAAHDGRWSWALACAEARTVHGVEARTDLVVRFAECPDREEKDRVMLFDDDIFSYLDQAVEGDQTDDVIAAFDIFYHLMDHHRLFLAIRRSSPALMIVDSEFDLRPNPVIQLVCERTDVPVNTTSCFLGQEIAVKGRPSFAALEVIAGTLGYDVCWTAWSVLPKGQRHGVSDYFRAHRWRRGTCVLTPRQGTR